MNVASPAGTVPRTVRGEVRKARRFGSLLPVPPLTRTAPPLDRAHREIRRVAFVERRMVFERRQVDEIYFRTRCLLLLQNPVPDVRPQLLP